MALGRRAAVLASAAGLGLIVAGCGGGDEPSAAAGSTDTPADTARATEVEMTDFAYSPKSLRVRVGEKVTFVNKGQIEHTVADTDASGNVVSLLIMPRPIAAGESQSVSFDKPGTVRYLCTFHPTLMSGTITVEPAR
jgi:plastocyanin